MHRQRKAVPAYASCCVEVHRIAHDNRLIVYIFLHAHEVLQVSQGEGWLVQPALSQRCSELIFRWKLTVPLRIGAQEPQHTSIPTATWPPFRPEPRALAMHVVQLRGSLFLLSLLASLCRIQSFGSQP